MNRAIQRPRRDSDLASVVFAGVIKQVKDFVSSNHSWFGLDPEKRQKVLDYACGAGTVSEVNHVSENASVMSDFYRRALLSFAQTRSSKASTSRHNKLPASTKPAPSC